MVHLKAIVVLGLLGFALAAPSAKIDLKLKNALAKENSKVNIMIKMRESTSNVLNSISNTRFIGRNERLDALHTSLQNLAARSQKDILSFLKRKNLKYDSFWINNMIFVANADLALAEKLASFYEVDEIYQENIAYIEKPEFVAEAKKAPKALQWGVQRIGADRTWALPGNTDGFEVVVGNIDTGVRHTHVTLSGNWRRNYGWYDPSAQTSLPVDDIGHGTHTMGIMTGAVGIGVAPGALWIACRGCAGFSCTQRDLTACAQFMTCPHNTTGLEPNCSLAPHLVSNSWGGGGTQAFYDAIIGAWSTAGIIPIFATGNSGPTCGTLTSPADYMEVVSVGSTNETLPDSLASSGSQGPAGSLIKPDITAPGVNIYSAYNLNDTSYMVMSGSSFSAPHAAGAIALIIGAAPNATVSDIKSILFNHASRNVTETGMNCGGIPESQWPNNAFGHGRIDVYSSIMSLRARKHY